jgi:hypothetical protein
LIRHLRRLASQADSGRRRYALAVARLGAPVEGAAAGRLPLSRRLRPGELLAMADENALALVGSTTHGRGASRLDQRLAAMLREDLALEPERCVVVHYPDDAGDADGLLARALAQIALQTEVT